MNLLSTQNFMLLNQECKHYFSYYMLALFARWDILYWINGLRGKICGIGSYNNTHPCSCTKRLTYSYYRSFAVSAAKRQPGSVIGRRRTDTSLNGDLTVLELGMSNSRSGSQGSPGVTLHYRNDQSATTSQPNLCFDTWSNPSIATIDRNATRRVSPSAPFGDDDVINSLPNHSLASLFPFRPPSPVCLALPTDDIIISSSD